MKDNKNVLWIPAKSSIDLVSDVVEFFKYSAKKQGLDIKFDLAYDMIQSKNYADLKLKEYDLILIDNFNASMGVVPLENTDHNLLTGVIFFEDFLKDKPEEKPVSVQIWTFGLPMCVRANDYISQKSYKQIKGVVDIGFITKKDLFERIKDSLFPN